MPAHIRQEPFSIIRLLGPSHNLFMFLCVYVFSWAVGLYFQLRKVREARLTDEVSFLKSQINPHFLFNTLNSIYSLSITKSDQAPDAIARLSSLMRYSVTDSEKEKVPLGKELDYIRDYISLQKLRMPERAVLDVRINGDEKDKEIAPLILIPFIENAFRFGVNTEQDSLIAIQIGIDANTMVMKVFNNKVPVHHDVYDQAGPGINSTKSRLEYLYPQNHLLEIEDGWETFRIRLEITLS